MTRRLLRVASLAAGIALAVHYTVPVMAFCAGWLGCFLVGRLEAYYRKGG